MSRIKRAVLWAALFAIVVLGALSVYGAFLGADRAQAFFNSVPLAVYWCAVVLLLVVGLLLFRRLARMPALLFMHVGPVLVLLGGMWGSPAGHTIRNRLLGTDVVREGQMGIFEGMTENRVQVADSNDLRELPFSVRLRDFRMEYYQPGLLTIHGREGQAWRLDAEPGAEVALGGEQGSVRVERVFQNFKIGTGEPAAYDAPGGSNPAVQVAIERPGGTTTRRYIFERFAGHPQPQDDLFMTYRLMVRDYVSELEIIDGNEVAASKDIEVNHPLHYGGYHFYQHSYGQDRGREYTVLMVVSDAGLNVVYAGYVLLVGGILWQFWGRRVLRGGAARPRAEEVPIAPGSPLPDEKES
jgi:hypothetical protein